MKKETKINKIIDHQIKNLTYQKISKHLWHLAYRI